MSFILKFLLKKIFHKVILLFVFLFLSVSLCAESYSAPKNKITIGILYKRDLEKRYNSGVERALSAHPFGKTNVKLVPMKYLNERQGLEMLLDVVRKKKVDIIFGPTDSGVFFEAEKYREELAYYKVPVISPLVTAPVSMREDGWLFRTYEHYHKRYPFLCMFKD
jgi:ABC-type uncharacterized transport system substrate-binding protein